MDLAGSLHKEHDTIDVLVNNAGVNLDPYSAENARKTLDVNYRGTLRMCQAFAPLMEKGGRIVNLSSIACKLDKFHPTTQARFRKSDMTIDELDQLMNEFQESADAGTEKQDGWLAQAYSPSKAAVTALTAIMSRQYPSLQINACCPGWVETDMGSMVGSPPKSLGTLCVGAKLTAADGASIPFRLAFEDIGDVTGRYWANDSLASTESGKVQEW